MKRLESFADLLPPGGVGAEQSEAKPEPQPITGELVESCESDSSLFTDSHHSRGDARMLLQMLSLGVVTVEESKKFLKRAFDLGMKTDSPREYAALAKVIQGAAKIELEANKQKKPKTPQLHLHGHVDANTSTIGTADILAQIAAQSGLPRLAERSRSGEFGSG